MVARYVLFAALVATLFVVPSKVEARTNLSRAEIRSMPILERPGRPGHFYGNAVRRNAARAGVPTGQGASYPGQW